jgi:hypothetical protein
MDLPSYFGNSPGGRVRLLFLTALGLFSSLTTVEGQRRFRPDSISYTASGSGHGQLRGIEAIIDAAGDTAIFKANGTVWNVSCGRDETTRGRTCTLTQQWQEPALTVLKRADGAVLVRVGEERSTYVGTDVEVRIDGRQVYTAPEPGWNATRSAEIVSALRKGRSVVTTFVQWPSDNSVETRLDLTGFDVAMEFMKFAVH